jgi:hypothetical protein
MSVAGRGEAFRYRKGSWTRAPEFDYEFSFHQERYGALRETTKEIHRRHPHFPWYAGPRDVTMHFEVREAPSGGGAGAIGLTVVSSLGPGSGESDSRGENLTLTIGPIKGLFLPYNTMKITQSADPRTGVLRETVELVKRKRKGPEAPYMKIEETGTIYLPARPAQSPVTTDSLTGTGSGTIAGRGAALATRTTGAGSGSGAVHLLSSIASIWAVRLPVT